MHIVHLTESMHVRTGGPAHSVSNLAAATMRSGRGTAEIISPETPRDGARAEIDPLAKVRYVPTPQRTFSCGRQLFRTLRQAAEQPDTLLHMHLMWRGHFVAAAHYARRAGRPYLVSPRGTLEPWCLEYRGGRKRVFWKLLERRRLMGAAALHATSAMEAENLQRLLPGKPIAVVPNGLILPTLPPRPTGGRQRTALFLSRIHPKKGLPLLIEAWSQVRPVDWRLLIVGPDELNHAQQCRELGQRLGVADAIEFRDSVSGQAKWDLYQQADLFVLPTLSENFGIVVAEALAAETPVLTTTAAPWEELNSRRCGFWAEPTVESIALELRKATQQPREELREMGARGRALVSEKYSLDATINDMLAVYEWALHGGAQPACFHPG
jgi:glycosyltransferase involved in cell wall biosynthesis